MDEENAINDSEQQLPVLVRVKRISQDTARKQLEKSGVSTETIADKILKWGSAFVLIPGVGPIGAKPVAPKGYEPLIPLKPIGGTARPISKPVELGVTVNGRTVDDIGQIPNNVYSFENPAFDPSGYDPIEMEHGTVEQTITHEDAAERLNRHSENVTEQEFTEIELDNLGREQKESTPKNKTHRKPKRGPIIDETHFNETEGLITYRDMDEPRFMNKGVTTRTGQKWNEIELNNLSNISHEGGSSIMTEEPSGFVEDFDSSTLGMNNARTDWESIFTNEVEEDLTIRSFSNIKPYKPVVFGGNRGNQWVPEKPSVLPIPFVPIGPSRPTAKGGIFPQRFAEAVVKRKKKKHPYLFF